MTQIPGFPKYKITKDGRIWSFYGKGRWLNPTKNQHGRLRIILCRDGKHYHKEIHRLVLETYRGKCPEGMESCHNNGNKLDNRVDNLRWDTRSNNHKDAVKHGTAPFGNGEQHVMAKLTEKDVKFIIYLYRIGLFTQRQIGMMYGVKDAQISRIIHRKR